uniref:Uncharacterized protein n=2 Tax=Oryza TaxID=4527 RepID=A0A0D3HLE9_9ORYZ
MGFHGDYSSAPPPPQRTRRRRSLLFSGGRPFPGCPHMRAFSTAEAREEIEAAMDSKETVYFDDVAACVHDAAGETLPTTTT